MLVEFAREGKIPAEGHAGLFGDFEAKPSSDAGVERHDALLGKRGAKGLIGGDFHQSLR